MIDHSLTPDVLGSNPATEVVPPGFRRTREGGQLAWEGSSLTMIDNERSWEIPFQRGGQVQPAFRTYLPITAQSYSRAQASGQYQQKLVLMAIPPKPHTIK